MNQSPQMVSERRGRLWGALAAIVFSGLLLMGYMLWAAYDDAWADARRTAANEAELIDARLESTLRRVDADLVLLAERTPQAALSKQAAPVFRMSVEKELERLRVAFPEVAGFRVIDSEGDVLYLSGGGEYVNLADRPYFSVHRGARDLGILFSDLIVSRITGRSAVAASRAIRDTSGEFRGVVTAAIETSYFSKLLNAVTVGPSGALTIGRSDNHATIVRLPSFEWTPQEMRAEHPALARMDMGEQEGGTPVIREEDGVSRVSVFRVLRDYPFYVMVGVAEADVLARWRQEALVTIAIGGLTMLALVLGLLWLFRAQRRELQASADLQHHQGLLKAAQRIAQLGSWEFDRKTRRITCSDELLRIFEFQPKPEGFRYSDFAELFHPEDRARVDEVMGKPGACGSQDSMKHRLLMPDGRVKHVLENLETQCDADGNPVRVIGTTQDITRQHHLEARMQLLASAFEHSGESILITDRENRIVAVNPAFTRLTGYSAEDALGRDPKMLSAGRTSREEYRKMWEVLTERDFWQGEIWDRRRDGTVYPKWLSISVIRDDDGAVAYYVAHFTDVTMERATEAKLHHMAHHDVLTGLLNRFSLGNRLDQALALARRNRTRVALLFIDLDRFKVINDTLGHQVGDALLVEVAERLRASVRETDVVARLGGDEFVVMLTGIEQAETVAAVAEKLVFNVGSPYLLGENQLYTTPSIGIALYPNDGDTADVLMKNADAAMYHAKNAGRNNFQFFDARMNDMAIERLGIENALRQALKRDEFVLHFQPILDVASGRVVSVEALVRWQHPERGLLMPGAFIEIAEESGLIQPIGDWVFWAACRQLAGFRALGLDGVRMGINISAIQMRNSSLPVMVQGALDAYDLQASDLVLEITESAAMDKPEQTVVLLDKLHSMGVNLAIDDFGTGYSSLGYLRMFPISHLKLDRSFVEEIQRGGRSVICDATIGLAHNLGMRIVAEGVETEEQLEYLRARQCDLAQGYYFSRPVSADAAIEFIRRCNSR